MNSKIRFNRSLLDALEPGRYYAWLHGTAEWVILKVSVNESGRLIISLESGAFIRDIEQIAILGSKLPDPPPIPEFPILLYTKSDRDRLDK